MMSQILLHSMKRHTEFSPVSSPPPTMEVEEDEENDEYNLVPKPIRADWFVDHLISFLADLIYNCLVVLTSPITYLLSVASRSYRRAAATTAKVEKAVYRAPSKITHGSKLLLRRTWVGLLGALRVSVLLLVVMLLAATAGVGLVRMYLEEPVVVKERLFFDYTDVNPNAVFYFDGEREFGGGYVKKKKQVMGVPTGHTIHVSLVLILPESDFNRNIGLFQLTAELLSSKGETIVKSSQPCMLRFRSLPIRLTRTLLLGVPLLIGISSETQVMDMNILKHKEGHPRTRAVRLTLIPRAGTSFLPQLYESEIAINSKPPWNKRLVYNWKWTLYVWASLYLYIAFLVILLCCCRPLLFPVWGARTVDKDNDKKTEAEGSTEETSKGREDEKDIAEMMRRWREKRRSKRKAMFSQKALPEAAGSSASSMSLTRDDTSGGLEEVEDSESCT